MTFDPHPAEVVRPGSHPAVLTEPARKAELIEALGVDVLCVMPFTVEFSRLPAETFVHDVLVEHLHAALVVVGDNFRFGHRAAGDVALLGRLGRSFGFTVEGAPLVRRRGTVFSSTYIRSPASTRATWCAAAAALGRPHRVEGVVVRGDQRGREIGFPTANLLPTGTRRCRPTACTRPVLGRRGTAKRWPRRWRSARTRRSPAGSAGWRRTRWTSPATCTANGWPWTSWRTCVSSGRYDAIEPLVAQMAEDVERTRPGGALTRPDHLDRPVRPEGW